MTVGWLSSRELFNGELVAIPNPLSLRAFCRAEGVAISVVKKIKKTELILYKKRLPRQNASGVLARNDKNDEVASLLAMTKEQPPKNCHCDASHKGSHGNLGFKNKNYQNNFL